MKHKQVQKWYFPTNPTKRLSTIFPSNTCYFYALWRKLGASLHLRLHLSQLTADFVPFTLTSNNTIVVHLLHTFSVHASSNDYLIYPVKQGGLTWNWYRVHSNKQQTKVALKLVTHYYCMYMYRAIVLQVFVKKESVQCTLWNK